MENMELESTGTDIMNAREEIERLENGDSEEVFCDCNEAEIVEGKWSCNEHDGTVSVNSEDVKNRSKKEDRRPDSEERIRRLEEDEERLCAKNKPNLANKRNGQPPSIKRSVINKERRGGRRGRNEIRET
jgi:hypothetical protein